MNKLMEVNAVTKIYHNGSSFKALEDVSLTVDVADYLAISGPSGAGKSTLLHIMAGLDLPNKGEVFYRGKGLSKMRDRELSLWRNRNIGFIFQFYHLIEELNILENIAICAFGARRKYAFKKAKELLKYLGLEVRWKAFPSQLSGGEKQRAAIARALINEPEIIFCDEPTGSLDKESQEKVVELLADLNQHKNKTIVLVTHNRSLAKEAKRVLIIENGKINGGNG